MNEEQRRRAQGVLIFLIGVGIMLAGVVVLKGAT